VQALAAVQDTSENEDRVEFAGCGVVWVLQVVPSQDSTRVSFPLVPTALQGTPDGSHERFAR
jgi:hypothetical protein